MTTPLHAACYADLRAWLRRKRRYFLIAAGGIGAGCILYHAFTRYSSDPPQIPPGIRPPDDDEQQHLIPAIPGEGEPDDHLEQHFQGIQVLADATALPPVLARFKEALYKLIDISLITRKLLAGKEGPQALSASEKQELWQKVKILSFTRAISAAWGLGLAQLFIRLQLNVLGRKMLIHQDLNEGIQLATQERFMGLTDFFLEQGYKLLARDAEEAVNRVIGDLSLKSLYKLGDLRELFLRIRAAFSEAQEQSWSRYLLPEDVHQEEDELVMELRQVISSPEFNATLGSVLDSLLEFTMQELAPSFESSSLPLAKVIPPVSTRGALLERADLQRLVEAIARLPQVNSLCMLVYSSNPGA